MSSLKKYFLLAVVIVQLALGIIPLAMAQDTPPAAPSPSPAADTPQKAGADSESFQVNKFLKAPGQDQKYFNSDSGSSKNGLVSVIVQAINFMVLTIGSVSFLAILIGGLTYMTSHGNETQVNKGKEIITYAIIGLVIALSAYFITAFVQRIFYEI